MDPYLLGLVESLLRVGLGLRFLSSGLSNLRRWPNPVKNSEIVFPGYPPGLVTFFAAVAVALMVFGGAGLVLGFLTQAAALCVIVFLIPTFKIHRHWIQKHPAMVAEVKSSLQDDGAKPAFQTLSWQAMHSHETGWMNNIILLLAALFFLVRGASAMGLDVLLFK